MNRSKLLPFLILLGLALTLISCKKEHFLTKSDYRMQVHKDFLERQTLAAGRAEALFAGMDTLPLREREALEFLYAYMPLSDLADYEGAFFRKQVEYAFKAKETFAWGDSVPETVFRHFVLVYRVNNENLDTARIFIFNELKDRVKNMSMYDAALEVNHWCHEKVCYRASDVRTSAPLATIKSTFGRCGEESTLTVTALRAVGIPARQCYTPRWAHTDDNHAWVEVWVQGKWYFMGACEPDAELNMGWFAIPSTRTMMVHTNIFGKYDGPEEVNWQTPLFSRVNLLPNYADTRKITITVTDTTGQKVSDAEVKYKLYNYAEYYPVAQGKSNSEGQVSLTTGYGDLLIWACKEGRYGYQKMDVRKDSVFTIVLNHSAGCSYAETFEIVPPVEKHNLKTVNKSKITENNRRLAYEDSLRTAYLGTFISDEDIAKIKNENLIPEQIYAFVKKSEGNYAEIITFLNQNSVKKEGLYLNEFLDVLSDKDFRDAEAAVLQQHITFFNSERYPMEAYVKGILPARISNEGLRSWRAFLAEKMHVELGTTTNSNALKEWINSHITVDNEANYFNCPLSPRGVYELRMADKHSRDIFFVAACRALDIPAYLDPATNQLFVCESNTWNIFTFDSARQNIPETGILTLIFNDAMQRKPEYCTHYTLAKFENGDFVTFDYENDLRVTQFPITLQLEAGYYMLSTGMRYSDGVTLSRLEFFNIDPNQNITKNVILRKLDPRNQSYGAIDLNYALWIDNSYLKISELVKEKAMIVCFIEPSREPTKHLFKDIKALKHEFEQWGGTILFVASEDKATINSNFASWGFPRNALYVEDKKGAWFANILTSTDQYFRDNYPVVYIVSSTGELIFKSEGYRIGTGELIYRSLKNYSK
ncbi:MAG: transglutaminase-like domain-containing protein [Bacteroidales bacterium]|jgi:hypothetical protein|nr:transglutaminase-like domain-containing protein [Bacteroidales bacterium]